MAWNYYRIAPNERLPQRTPEHTDFSALNERTPLILPPPKRYSGSSHSSNEEGKSQEGPQLRVRIPPCDDQAFDASLDDIDYKHEARSSWVKKKFTRNCSPSACWGNLKLLLVPILDWLPKYKWRNWLLYDLITGITIAMINISQGMAYGILANYSAINGLYTAFFPPLVYAIFGTSRHVSIGPMSLISSMVSTAVTKGVLLANKDAAFGTGNITGVTDHEAAMARSFLTMLVGMIMIVCGLLRLGFLASYLSDQLVEGLCFGAAVQFYPAFFKNLIHTNMVTFGLSASAFALLFVNHWFINPWMRKRILLPMPMELLVVIFGTLATYELNLNSRFQVSIVTEMSVGLPIAKWPIPRSGTYVRAMLPDAFMLAFMLFVFTVWAGKMIGEKYNYNIRATQEWLALGLVNMISGSFTCVPAGTFNSRSATQSDQRGKTQLAGVFEAVVILFVLFFCVQLLTKCPKGVLGAIITVTMTSMIVPAKVLPTLWRQSKVDFFIWIVSAIAVILLDIPLGLMVAVLFALGTVIYRSQWAACGLLGRIPNSNRYAMLSNHTEATEIDRVKIFRFDAPLYYANTDYFKHKLYAAVVNPANVVTRAQETDTEPEPTVLGTSVKYLIIDCSEIINIDVSGAQCLVKVYMEFTQINMFVFFANCKSELKLMLRKMGLFDKVPKWAFFGSVNDAVQTALANEQTDLKTAVL